MYSGKKRNMIFRKFIRFGRATRPLVICMGPKVRKGQSKVKAGSERPESPQTSVHTISK